MRRREFLAVPITLINTQAADQTRPRLFLTKAKIDKLKQKISGSHAELWAMVLENADRHLARMPSPKFDSESEMRSNGRGIPWQALAWLLSGDVRYRDGAKRWMLAICEFPRWENNKSLAAGECLFGIAVGYDWLYGELDDRERVIIRDKLVLQAEALRKAPVHRDIWLANHNHVEHLGLAAAGFALRGEIPEAENWIQQSASVFRKAMEFSGSDGGSTEGHQYWAYSAESILRYAELSRDLLKENIYPSDWLKSVPDFIIHSTIPDFTAENCVMSYGDSHRSYDSHGPAHILFRTAAEYRNPCAQWLALEMIRRRVGRTAYCGWASLLWYDETLRSTPISSLPTAWNCDDVGWVTARSSWNPDAVMVGFKSGPMHGRKAQQYYDEHPGDTHEIGGGHGHPDVNSFQIYAYGKWLAIDPGYEKPKATRNHNTVLVNGKGQLGEGQTWFDRKPVLSTGAKSAIVKMEHHGAYDYVLGDGISIYPAAAGLTKFRRHFVFLRPDYVIMVDELAADQPSQFDWLMHGEEVVEQRGNSAFLVRNGDVVMDVQFLHPEGVVAKTSEDLLTATVPASTGCIIAAVLHPRKVSAPAATAKLDSRQGARLTIAVGGKKVSLDLAGQRVTIA